VFFIFPPVGLAVLVEIMNDNVAVLIGIEDLIVALLLVNFSYGFTINDLTGFLRPLS